jgi:hypothetical protein
MAHSSKEKKLHSPSISTFFEHLVIESDEVKLKKTASRFDRTLMVAEILLFCFENPGTSTIYVNIFYLQAVENRAFVYLYRVFENCYYKKKLWHLEALRNPKNQFLIFLNKRDKVPAYFTPQAGQYFLNLGNQA